MFGYVFYVLTDFVECFDTSWIDFMVVPSHPPLPSWAVTPPPPPPAVLRPTLLPRLIVTNCMTLDGACAEITA